MHERVATGLALGILGNLVRFSHSFVILYQSVITRGRSKDELDKVELKYASIDAGGR